MEFFPIARTRSIRTSTSRRPAKHRVRQRDDHYAHEALTNVPYEGILVSKAMVDGTARGPANTHWREPAPVSPAG